MASEPISGPAQLTEAAQSERLLSKSFQGLLYTQFLGATNDNILRWLVIGVGKQYVTESQVGWVLTAGTAAFVLPYLLLAAPAGFLADRFGKNRVIVACKLAEIVIMAGAIAGILSGSVAAMLLVLALMGSQSALFGPSKLGSIPEMLSASKISSANGLIGLTTVLATTVGAAVGMWLADATGERGRERWWLSALVLIGVAVAGWLTSLLIARLPAANPTRKFPWDLVRQTWRDLKALAHSRDMLRVALGVMFFWSLGAMAQLNIDQFAFEGGATRQTQVTPLLVALVVGVGLGSVLAGLWSSGRVELGILPLGAGGLAFSALMLFTVEGTLINPGQHWTASYVGACSLLFLLGCSAGLFDVPLAAYMQHRSPVKQRGSILAASNFLTFGGMLVAALAFGAMRSPMLPGSFEQLPEGVISGAEEKAQARDLYDQMQEIHQADGKLSVKTFVQQHPQQEELVRAVHQEVVGHPLLSARQIFLLCGVLTIPVFVYIVCLIPQASLRFLAWLVTHTVYRVRVLRWEKVPKTGPALLVPNHISWLDGLFLIAVSPRPIRMIISAELTPNWWLKGLARIMGAIPIRRQAPRSTISALETAREALNHGELVCVFPEGDVTRSGQLQPFRPAALEVVRGTPAEVVPVYLDELWGSIFSYRGGRLFRKLPRLRARRVSIWIGEKLSQPVDIHTVRQAVQDLGAEAASGRKELTMVLPRLMLRKCRKAMFRLKIADSTGMELTGGSLLMRSLIARRLLNNVLQTDEKYLGVLLPPSVGAVVTNAATTLSGRVAVNLNYTVTNDLLNACIRKAGIRHVLTSRKVLEKLDFDIEAEVIVLEDLRETVTLADKLVSALLAYVMPMPLLERVLGVHKLTGDDELTVIFTSGSTGDPKGVVLTNHNIGSNVEAIDQVIHLRSDDTLMGILPFFHSFGYMVTLWTVLGLDVRCVYHFTPLDAKQVGKLAGKWGVTVLLSTPTFLRSYVRRCTKEDFAKLEIVVAGAEKLPSSLCDAFEEKFGVRPVEGYGATELSPLVSVNVPPQRSQTDQTDCKEGTVGRPVPGVSVKTVDPETQEDLPLDTSGMLLVKGANVMKGYMGEPDKTAKVVRDGWYVTGDIAKIDAEGFIQITGRLSRFSKIGGEMVPHLNIEEAIQAFVQDEEDEEVRAVVSAVPDAKKGERIVVIHTKLVQSPQEICDHLAALNLPNLWIPAPDSFLQVETIPLLGTGKLDLKGLSAVALEHFGGQQ